MALGGLFRQRVAHCFYDCVRATTPHVPCHDPPCNLPAHRCRHLPALVWQYAGPSTLPYRRDFLPLCS
jgi:hypothetical protein